MWITTNDSISRGGSRDRNWGLRGIKRCSRHSMIVCIASLVARSQLPELFISSCNRFHPFRYPRSISDFSNPACRACKSGISIGSVGFTSILMIICCRIISKRIIRKGIWTNVKKSKVTKIEMIFFYFKIKLFLMFLYIVLQNFDILKNVYH